MHLQYPTFYEHSSSNILPIGFWYALFLIHLFDGPNQFLTMACVCHAWQILSQ